MLNGKANLYFYLGLWKLGKLKVVFCHVLVFAIISYIKDWLQLVVGYWTASWWWCCTCVSCLNTYGFTNYPVQGQKIFFFPWSDGQGSLEFLLCGDLWLLPAIILAFHSDSWCNACDFLLLSSLVLLSFIFLMDCLFFFLLRLKMALIHVFWHVIGVLEVDDPFWLKYRKFFTFEETLPLVWERMNHWQNFYFPSANHLPQDEL